MWQTPGQSDGIGCNLANSDGGGYRGSDYIDTVADAVLAVDVLHCAHDTGQTVSHCHYQQ